MTTYIAFQPQPNTSPPFQAIVTLDGNTYSLTCWWNLVGRWYYSLADQTGTVVYTGGLVASPDTMDIYLAPALFQTSTIVFRASTGNFEVSP